MHRFLSQRHQRGRSEPQFRFRFRFPFRFRFRSPFTTLTRSRFIGSQIRQGFGWSLRLFSCRPRPRKHFMTRTLRTRRVLTHALLNALLSALRSHHRSLLFALRLGAIRGHFLVFSFFFFSFLFFSFLFFSIGSYTFFSSRPTTKKMPLYSRDHRVRAVSHSTSTGLTIHHRSQPVPVHAGPFLRPVRSFTDSPFFGRAFGTVGAFGTVAAFGPMG